MIRSTIRKIFSAGSFVLLGYFNSFSQDKGTDVDRERFSHQPEAMNDYHTRMETQSREITYLVNDVICTKEEVYSLNPEKIISVEYLPPSTELFKLYGERSKNGLFIIKASKYPFLKHKKSEGIREIQIFLANAVDRVSNN